MREPLLLHHRAPSFVRLTAPHPQELDQIGQKPDIGQGQGPAQHRHRIAVRATTLDLELQTAVRNPARAQLIAPPLPCQLHPQTIVHSAAPPIRTSAASTPHLFNSPPPKIGRLPGGGTRRQGRPGH
ncbi:unnamed protein product [[Actinomadura] parvosata subsp. kistnae]|nr:unnamed protein product [Actinomadura parvosata subsp. kistnae]